MMIKPKHLLLTLIIFVCFCACKDQKHEHGEHTHVHNEASNIDNQNYFDEYMLSDEVYGTKTSVTITETKRIMVTNSLPNHNIGKFPNEGNPNTIAAQNRKFEFPLKPVFIGKPTWIREPGIAINGIKFEPGTGEVVQCESGENYRVEAFQDIIDLGLDFNNAHVQPTGAYHYHGAPVSIIETMENLEDLVHIGFAHDGFPIYYSRSDKYKPSYRLVEGIREGEDCSYERPGISVEVADGGHHDGTFNSDFEFVDGLGDLDECNGITIDDEYMYLVTSEFPYVSRCLMGAFESNQRGGPPPNRPAGKQDLNELFEKMDVNKDDKITVAEAEGPLKQMFKTVDIDNDDFLSKEELKKHLIDYDSRPKR